ncbi:hypothetical protein [Tychonema sp. LEGE 07203]|uniref:hypothetical protein n=1 Tax=Tychonema sp. LEGE 07203 TaxID=1828671 RepID=UPI001882BC58|nr:hypothetical protein [Tychonema sp. LEGE 07203]MBE9092935.1 hypothetical protein [Tychonema sp. LEGE 07203]
MSESLQLGSFRVIGTKTEITNTLAFLRTKGCVWNSKEKYHAQRGDANKFAYYLNNVRTPLVITFAPNPNEPQPKPYDAVLGDKRRSNQT